MTPETTAEFRQDFRRRVARELWENAPLVPNGPSGGLLADMLDNPASVTGQLLILAADVVTAAHRQHDYREISALFGPMAAMTMQPDAARKLTPEDTRAFCSAFHDAADADKNGARPLVPNGPSFQNLAAALDDRRNPVGQILLKAAAVITPASGNRHGYATIIRIVQGMAASLG